MKGSDFRLMNGLLPAVIQDYETNEVLMVGYVNADAWELTVSDGRVHYYSRKKKRIWLKGEQSGHYQIVKEVFLNCDNTCLLIKVKQISGACDTGLRSCFDKVLKGDKFESTGVKVFDPHSVYGEKFTQDIRLGIPGGSVEAMTFQLLELAGYEVEVVADRLHHSRVVNTPDFKLLMASAQEIPFLVAQDSLDAGIVGMDLVEEAGVSVTDICDLGYNKLGLGPVIHALATPFETTTMGLKDLEGKRLATNYENLVRRLFSRIGIAVDIVPCAGNAGEKVPLLADAVVELVETGETLRTKGFKPLLKVFETTVHFIANNESWSYTWKRRKLQEIADKLSSAAQKLPRSPKKNIALPAVFSMTGGRLSH